MVKKKSDLSGYVESAKNEIEVWEKKQPGFIAGVGNVILKPVELGLGKIIPKGTLAIVSKGIEKSLQGLNKLISFTVDRKKVLAEYKKRSEAQKDFDGSLKIADDMAKEALSWHVAYGVTQGAAYGVLGWPGLAPNIPTLFGIAIRAINEIGFVYGYGIDSPEEKEYMLKILQTGSAGDLKAKIEFIITLKQVEQTLLKVSWKRMTAELAAKQISKGAALASMRQFAKSIGVQLTKRKALQMIPIIGALIGGSFDGIYIHDVCETAYMSYRRRFIKQWQDQNNS